MSTTSERGKESKAVSAIYALYCHAYLIISMTVTLSSSVDQRGRTKVCPNETILYECFVMGPQLVWKFPGIFQLYNQNSDKNTVNNTGPVSVWLTNSTNEHLKSTMILTYTTNISTASIECNNKISLYDIAGELLSLLGIAPL